MGRDGTLTIVKARRLVVRVCNALERKYGAREMPSPRPPLEELLLGVLAQGSSERSASRAYRRLTQFFVDLNEVRVSTPKDIEAAISDLPNAEDKAYAVKETLSHVFNKRNEISLGFLEEASAAEARRFFAEMEDTDRGVIARVMLFSLGHPAMPLNAQVDRVSSRLGLIQGDGDSSESRARLEKIVPSDRMFDVHSLFNEHGRKACLAARPKCSRSVVRSYCRTGKKLTASSRKTRSRSKSKSSSRSRSRSTRS